MTLTKLISSEYRRVYEHLELMFRQELIVLFVLVKIRRKRKLWSALSLLKNIVQKEDKL